MRGGRPLKRWRYAGAYGPGVMVCAADARVGPLRQRWWALALPDGRILEQTSMFGSAGMSFDGPVLVIDTPRVQARLEWGPGTPVETLSPHGRQLIWTRKQAGVAVHGTLRVEGREVAAPEGGVVDESAGYHARRTAWRWSAGVGQTDDGLPVAWNLVAGMHDAPEASERTVWLQGEPRHVPPVDFAPDLTRVGALGFRPWAERTADTNAVLVRSRYRQPFGEFSGTLPDGTTLARGWGVMEDHDVRW